ncbi:hypothetical protein SAMN05421810_105370 [Amycolatopsis arida]|uniref:Zinc-finger n=1 Tax=Amycolatopsis arida TaxID=587909 RepID=A0A1I5X0P5_9PSEU|nr:hypothetical protein [Amycolatopsis arida]TDX92544.1 hypothetical protein CLV69_105389 [Amycolatopsis arida]SFQ25508.1 hypothetical protein SAMN05421810_105370 [Amycolatopsis arida]
MRLEPRWCTVAQMWHVVVERRGDALLTGCGWLVWPGAYDARMATPPTCVTCRYLYPEHTDPSRPHRP